MMNAAETQIIIAAVPFSAILDAPNADLLLRAYAEECAVPDATPQRAVYAALEQVGAIRCFAAYSDTSDLIGFISVLAVAMPHGNRLATIESLFVDPAYRSTGAANFLLDAAEQDAQASGCSNLAATARVGSAFEKVLSRRPGYSLTHSQHTRRLI